MKIAVVIPVRDRLEMLERAVESVLAQTRQPEEFLIIDDGSSMDLSSVRHHLESHGYQWIRQEPRGVSAARNAGIRESCAEWVAFLDADDVWKPEKLKKQEEFHIQNPEILISQCEEQWIRNGKRVNKKAIHQMPSGDAFLQSLQLCCISPSSVMLHRSLFTRYGTFDEALPVCEDYDLWIRITPFESIGYISEPLVTKYGGHSDQLSRSEPAMDRFRVYAIIKLLEDGTISNEQRTLAKAEATQKIHILKTGAQKHAPQTIPLYEALWYKVTMP